MASKKTIEVLKLYRKGCNCFQAVALPFCDELSLDKLMVVQSFSGFDHSVIGDSAVCGALLGALYVVSLKCRGDDPAESRKKALVVCRELADAFKKEMGSDICCGKKEPQCDRAVTVAAILAEKLPTKQKI